MVLELGTEGFELVGPGSLTGDARMALAFSVEVYQGRQRTLLERVRVSAVSFLRQKVFELLAWWLH